MTSIIELVPSNIRVLAAAKQSDANTPATVPTIAFSLTDCQLKPGRTTAGTPESDSTAQQPSIAVSGAQAGGTFKKYIRPSQEDFLLAGLLGKTVDTGTTPHYVHTSNIDPTAPVTIDYFTFWDIWPGITTTQYNACRIGQVAYSGQPGQVGVEGEWTIVSAYTALGADEPDLTGLDVSGTETPHGWPELAVSLGGVHGGVVNSINLTISRNLGRFFGDNGFATKGIPVGLAAVTGSLAVAFEDDTFYRAGETGTTTGTVLTSTIFEEALAIVFLRTANLGVAYNIAEAQISNFDTPMSTDGSPAVSTFDFNSQRQADVTNLIQTVVKNTLATAAR